MGSELEHWAHGKLQDATLDYYDALRPILKDANATEELWEERNLWPVDRKRVRKAVCESCGEIFDAGQAGKPCSKCEEDVLAGQVVDAVDENGQPLFVWESGLKTLDDVRLGVVERERTYTDALGEHSTTTVERDLMPSERLFRALDVLDEALQKLDLLVSIDDELPEGQLAGEA
jgi:CRISPR/Cas system CMR subunit Cmr4 (Cas7 group RAMP superfamily)